MLGVKLVVHAIKVLFHNVWATVRLTVLPMAIGYGFAFLLVYLLAGDVFVALLSGAEEIQPESKPGFWVAVFLAIVITAITFCWAAVGWHRFVLLDEQPGALLPRFSWDYTKSYIWAGVRLLLISFALLVPAVLFMGFINQIGSVGHILNVVVSLVIYVLLLRVSLILPAAALGRPMSLGESWKLTAGKFVTWLAVALSLTVLNGLAEAILAPGYLGWAISIFLGWLSFAVGISILTTIYGVYVENREL